MSTATENVHEAETQRQFVRLQFPAQVTINDKKYPIRDLSTGGIAISGISGLVKRNETISFKLTLPFSDFAMDVELKAQIQHIDTNNDITGCRFIDLNPKQISVLTHVIKSYMAGDIVAADDMLNVVSRENFVKVRKQKNNNISEGSGNKGKITKFLSYSFLSLLAIAVSIFIIGNIFERVFIIKTGNGIVEKEYITATINMEDSHRIKIGTKTLMKIIGTTNDINGEVTDIRAQKTPNIMVDNNFGIPVSVITIKPENNIDKKLINRPVQIEFLLYKNN